MTTTPPASVVAMARIQWAAHGYVADVETYYPVAKAILGRVIPLVLDELRQTYTIPNEFTTDRDELALSYGGRTILLRSLIQAKIAQLMCMHPGRVFSREELMNEVGMSIECCDRSVDYQIRGLRKTLRIHWPEQKLIKTFSGVGYAWVGDE